MLPIWQNYASNLAKLWVKRQKGTKGLSVEWIGFLNPNATGDYLLGIKADGFARVSVNDRLVTQGWGNGTKLGQVHLEKGSAVKLDVTYSRSGDGGKSEAQLIWDPVNNAPDPAAITAARNADVVVAVVGITSRLKARRCTLTNPVFLAEIAPASTCLSRKRT